MVELGGHGGSGVVGVQALVCHVVAERRGDISWIDHRRIKIESAVHEKQNIGRVTCSVIPSQYYTTKHLYLISVEFIHQES